jgi:hypothetical protein
VTFHSFYDAHRDRGQDRYVYYYAAVVVIGHVDPQVDIVDIASPRMPFMIGGTLSLSDDAASSDRFAIVVVAVAKFRQKRCHYPPRDVA